MVKTQDDYTIKSFIFLNFQKEFIYSNICKVNKQHKLDCEII
jgi:hypothetical protein